ncbi:MAG TPA: helix-turn-helix domain-containing protein [Trebonia sp.]|jgi:transcriptional regulator with XRE-family HTH domain|nr:helix-turn-helix domain-containing protein [Trebonia sp.]
MDNRAQVREFLASRRARITPGQAGLPAYGGNRRVKGLRREEVALLAGVSIDYYIRMERGDLAGASEAVLDGVANALQLDEAEREHLQALARSARPAAAPRARPGPTTVRPVIQQVLDAITEAPAWIRNARHDILAMNPLAHALYSPVLDSAVAGATAKRAANTTRFIYLDRGLGAARPRRRCGAELAEERHRGPASEGEVAAPGPPLADDPRVTGHARAAREQRRQVVLAQEAPGRRRARRRSPG